MKPTIFLSWQSDVKAAACRTMIEHALEAARKSMATDKDFGIEPVIDRDTLGLPGAPDIGSAIFSKIDVASVFIADVTIIGVVSDRPTPNPNVIIETGYALKALGWERILLVMNTALGRPEDLPFDLRRKLAITYESPPDATERAPERKVLGAKLEAALRTILLTSKRPTEVSIALTYAKQNCSTNAHIYDLSVTLTNEGRRRIDDWELEIEVPTPLLTPTHIASRVAGRSNEKRTVFSYLGGAGRQYDSLRPGVPFPVKIGYMITNEIYWNRKELFEELMTARAMIDGVIVSEVEKKVEEIQDF